MSWTSSPARVGLFTYDEALRSVQRNQVMHSVLILVQEKFVTYFFVDPLDLRWVTALSFVGSSVLSVPKSFLKAFFRGSVRIRLRVTGVCRGNRVVF